MTNTTKEWGFYKKAFHNVVMSLLLAAALGMVSLQNTQNETLTEIKVSMSANQNEVRHIVEDVAEHESRIDKVEGKYNSLDRRVIKIESAPGAIPYP